MEIDFWLVAFRLSYGIGHGVLGSIQRRAILLAGHLCAMCIPDCAAAFQSSFHSWTLGWHREQRLGYCGAYRVVQPVHGESSQGSCNVAVDAPS